MIAVVPRTGARERRDDILRDLAEIGRVEVGDLAVRLAVTEETIRRDLRRLESEGLLRRAHGGAIPADPPGDGDRDRPVRSDADRAGSDAVGAALLEAVLARTATASAVYLDEGSRCEAVAPALAARPGVRVVTASIPVALAAARADGEVHFLGGTIDSRGGGSGQWAREQLAGLQLGTAVVEASGVSAQGRLLTTDPERAALKAAALRAARETIVLVAGEAADDEGTRGWAGFADADAVDLLLGGAQEEES